jgi:hypothetical protein
MSSPSSASPICSTSRISSVRPSSTLPALQVFPFTLPRLVIVALSQQRPPWPAVLSRRWMGEVQAVRRVP